MPFILLAILYACTSEYDGHANDAEKQIDPLTVATAQSLYEQYVGKASKLKSASDGFAPELLPDWSRGQLSSDSNWYVVESPLETSGDIRVRFMIPEVKEYCDLNTIRPPQVLRQVVMRNKQTGLDYAFVMVVMPELEYMLSKGDELDKNHYLTRGSDLSGLVIFYTTDGELINGWVYKNGNPAAVFGIPEEALGKRLKDWVAYNVCWFQWGGSNDDAYSIKYCEKYYEYEQNIIDLEGGDMWLEGDNDPSLPNTGSNTPSNNTPTDKKPETRNDCSGSATQNATNAQNAMMGNADITSKMNILRDYAKSKTNEWATLINSESGQYKGSELKEWYNSSAYVFPNANTIYDVHTHSGDTRDGYSVRTGFSIGDIRNVLVTGYDYSYANYKGTMVIAYDGSEYLLAINDRSMLQQFWGNTNNRAKFESDGGHFKDQKMNDEYWEIRDFLQEKKYTKDDAHDYALSYLLDKHNTGLKISKKEKGDNSFKETKTEKSATNDFKPTKCP